MSELKKELQQPLAPKKAPMKKKPETELELLKKEIASLKKQLEPKKAPVVVNEEKTKREKLGRMVKGLFKFHEKPGGVLKFSYRLPWKGAAWKQYELHDNMTEEIPYALAEQLLNKGKIPIHKNVKDEMGRPMKVVGKYRSRYDFFPINDFVNFDTKPKVAQVTRPGLVY